MKAVKMNDRPVARPSWLSDKCYPFQSHFFDFRGNRIHYLDEGEGLPIIFSHPAVGWSFMYRSLIKILREDYRCIAIDYPGFGLSEAHGQTVYTLQAQSEALLALIDHLKVKRMILLGHDTGGASAFTAALYRPESILGLILTDTIIFPVSEYPSIYNFLSVMESSLFRWVNRKFNLLMQVTSRFGFKTVRLSKTERRIYLQSFATEERRDALLKVLLDLRNDEALMRQVHAAFREKWTETPCLLMCGERDKLVSSGIFERTKKLLKNGTAHLIEGEEHFPHEGKAAEMAQFIKAWMNRHFVGSEMPYLYRT